MKTPRGIDSKAKPRDFLKRGFKSMFSNYDKDATPPVDTGSNDRGRVK